MSPRVRFTGEPAVWAVADSGRFRQVIRNLLTNARRYGGEVVEISAGIDADEVVVRVRDNGRGVPDDRWDRIFDPYEREKRSTSTPSSVGLGLTVSRTLARLMGGDLHYRYADGWSEFDIRVPTVSSSRPVTGATTD